MQASTSARWASSATMSPWVSDNQTFKAAKDHCTDWNRAKLGPSSPFRSSVCLPLYQSRLHQ